MDNPKYTVKRIPYPELARVFLMIGLLGFGGPIAHLALMETELVTKRQWLSREYFLDLLAAINLVPGPNSTEMALHIGYLTGGFFGMLLAGAGFILPAAIFSIILAMIYVSAGSVPAVRGVLSGVQPIVLVLILSAAYRLGLKALDNVTMRVLTLLAVVAVAIGSAPMMSMFGLKTVYIPELFILLSTGILYVLWKRLQTSPQQAVLFLPLTGLGTVLTTLVQTIPTPADLFWRFMVIGGTLFGSGYVIASYLQRTFVDNLGWLTPKQLLNVLAIGQATPGPLLSTSSAAGYVMTAVPGDVWSGVPGAIAATIGVFLPAFVVVVILGKIVPLLRRYPISLEFLKGVNAGVIALLSGTFATLAYSTLILPTDGIDWIAIILIAVAFILLERFKWNSLLLVAIGAGIGVLRTFIGI